MPFHIENTKDSSFQHTTMNDNSTRCSHGNQAKDNHNNSTHEPQRNNPTMGFHILNTRDVSFQRTIMNNNSKGCSHGNSPKYDHGGSTYKSLQWDNHTMESHVSDARDKSFQRTTMNDNSKGYYSNSARDNHNDSTRKSQPANRSGNKGETSHNVVDSRAAANVPELNVGKPTHQQAGFNLAQDRSAAAKRGIAPAGTTVGTLYTPPVSSEGGSYEPHRDGRGS